MPWLTYGMRFTCDYPRDYPKQRHRKQRDVHIEGEHIDFHAYESIIIYVVLRRTLLWEHVVGWHFLIHRWFFRAKIQQKALLKIWNCKICSNAKMHKRRRWKCNNAKIQKRRCWRYGPVKYAAMQKKTSLTLWTCRKCSNVKIRYWKCGPVKMQQFSNA